MFSKCIYDILSKYGQDVKILIDGIILAKTKAFISNLNFKNSSSKKTFKEFGEVEEGDYLYIGPEDVRLDLFDVGYVFINTENEEYLLKKAEKVYLKNDVIYIWAILSKHIREV